MKENKLVYILFAAEYHSHRLLKPKLSKLDIGSHAKIKENELSQSLQNRCLK